jgi:polyhydroxybutyrate depolymerase
MLRQIALILALLWTVSTGRAESTRTQVVRAAGLTRTYRLHIPDALRKNRDLPLVIVFHGSGADGAVMERLSKFSELADREGFVVAYPDAIGHEWNDGREARRIRSQATHVDDVAFVEAVITQISSLRRVDTKRIYAAGFSNGGIFAHYLGSKLADRLAAIAPVSGGVAEPVLRDFKPAAPLSVCMIHGAADRAVPYDGGAVDDRDYGRVLGAPQSASLWTLQANNLLVAPTTTLLSDTTSQGHRRVKFTRWSAPKQKTEVVLYTIENGGHGWPTDPKAPSVLKFWHGTHTFDTTKAIWDFFKNHPKP